MLNPNPVTTMFRKWLILDGNLYHVNTPVDGKPYLCSHPVYDADSVSLVCDGDCCAVMREFENDPHIEECRKVFGDFDLDG